MTTCWRVMGSKVAQLAPMNKKRVHQDMATLVMTFQNLSEVADPEGLPLTESVRSDSFSRPCLIRAFIESFSSRSDADLCLKDAIILAEYFDINELLNWKQSDLMGF